MKMDNEERDMSPIFIKDLGMRFPKEDSKEKLDMNYIYVNIVILSLKFRKVI